MKLGWEDLNKLTAEVIDPNGPGSANWRAEGSETQRVNDDLMRALRENGGTVPGELEHVPMLIITTTGAKTGQSRAVPLAYQVIGDRLSIIASMGGADRHPPWYHNLVANPAVAVEKDGETFAALAKVTTGADRDRLFQIICENFPVFADYQARTSRVIPVIELRLKFGMETQEYNERTCIIVVEVQGNNTTLQVGMLVDSVSEVLNITNEEIEPPPDFGITTDAENILGMGKIKGQVKILLDADRVVGQGLMEALESMSAS